MVRYIPRLFFRSVIAITAATLLITTISVDATADLRSLSDSELSAVYAEGFSNFTISDLGGGIHETLAEFNIHVYTYTTIDSLKLGYYDNAVELGIAGGGLGWDQDWTDVVIGQSINSPDKDFKAEGVYFRAEFENIDDPSIRELKSISFGSNSATGDISAYFSSFNGTVNATEYWRAPIGDPATGATVSFDDDPFEFSITMDKGFWVKFGDATDITKQVAVTYPRTYNMP